MKKLVLTFFVAAGSFVATSQVIFKVQSPSNIVGLYPFTNNGDGSNWGLANLNNPADAVEDTLMFVEDGTPGLNLQGHPISEEGCNTLTNNLTGKIAVIYRNTCGFGLKAQKAQTAGAVGVIIINREPALINMDGGTEGLTVNIPVTFISSVEGQMLTDAMALGSVVVFIGNKQDLFANDLGSLAKDRLIAKSFSNPSVISANAGEYSFELGLNVRNFGSADQVGATVTANVDFNGSSVYNATTAAFDVLSGDSSFQNFNPFSLTTYAPGRYTLSYVINLAGADEDPSDNTFTTDFMINDTLFSIAPLDSTRNYPVSTGGTQPSGVTTTYSACIVFQNEQAARLQAEGIYFSAVTNDTNSLSFISMPVKMYKIDSQFTDLNDAPATGSVLTTLLTTGYYDYPDETTDNKQDSVVYGAFNDVVVLENDVRYMFCVEAPGNKVFIGYNQKLSYETNIDTYLQPLVPVITGSSVNLVGFGGDAVPAIAVKMRSLTDGIAVNNMIEGSVYPNPANDEVYISLKAEGTAQLVVTDISGKTVLNSSVNLIDGKSKVNINTLSTGMYIFNVVLENGTKSQFNVVKK